MKAILEFDLPDEQEEFDVANNAWKFKSVLSELDSKLRSILKYEQDSHTIEELDFCQKIRDFMHDEIRERNIDIY